MIVQPRFDRVLVPLRPAGAGAGRVHGHRARLCGSPRPLPPQLGSLPRRSGTQHETLPLRPPQSGWPLPTPAQRVADRPRAPPRALFGSQVRRAGPGAAVLRPPGVRPRQALARSRVLGPEATAAATGELSGSPVAAGRGRQAAAGVRCVPNQRLGRAKVTVGVTALTLGRGRFTGWGARPKTRRRAGGKVLPQSETPSAPGAFPLPGSTVRGPPRSSPGQGEPETDARGGCKRSGHRSPAGRGIEACAPETDLRV